MLHTSWGGFPQLPPDYHRERRSADCGPDARMYRSYHVSFLACQTPIFGYVGKLKLIAILGKIPEPQPNAAHVASRQSVLS